MAKGDCAILVGISQYADKDIFGKLEGPPNDVKLFKKWLLQSDGGGLDGADITELTSPPDIKPGTDPDSVPPITEDFKRAFKKLVRDDKGRFINRPGRLYLYFSGHGFCDKKSLTPQGAIYAANATREFPENIYGTYYAQLAKEKALFREIVLVMDACRDAELNRAPDVPAINEAGSDASAGVKLFCAYAVPKGEKAQERPIPERNNETYGLLTHAFIKALSEAIPDAGASITGAALKRHMLETWPAICGDTPAPLPEIVLPGSEDVTFHSQYQGIQQRFRFASLLGVESIMEIFDHAMKQFARCVLRPPPNPSVVTWPDGHEEALRFDGSTFTLALQPGFYKCVLQGALRKETLFSVEGVCDVEL